MPVFEALLSGWKAQGYDLVSMHQYFETVKGALPRHEVLMREVEGRSGLLAVQG